MLTFKLYVRIVAPSVKVIEIHDNGSTPFNDSKTCSIVIVVYNDFFNAT